MITRALPRKAFSLNPPSFRTRNSISTSFFSLKINVSFQNTPPQQMQKPFLGLVWLFPGTTVCIPIIYLCMRIQFVNICNQMVFFVRSTLPSTFGFGIKIRLYTSPLLYSRYIPKEKRTEVKVNLIIHTMGCIKNPVTVIWDKRNKPNKITSFAKKPFAAPNFSGFTLFRPTNHPWGSKDEIFLILGLKFSNKKRGGVGAWHGMA